MQEPKLKALPASAMEPVATTFSDHRSTNSTESLGGLRYPPIGNLIAAAAFAFFLIAGVVFYLETRKGTLRIETNSESDVPIVIRQGDTVVEHLTVSKNGATTRLKAGQYIIEIIGDDTQFVIKGAKVELTRRKTWIATISEKPQRSADRMGIEGDDYGMPGSKMGGDYRKPDTGKADDEGATNALIGTWQLVEVNGKPVEEIEEQVSPVRLSFELETMRWIDEEGRTATATYSYQVDGKSIVYYEVADQQTLDRQIRTSQFATGQSSAVPMHVCEWSVADNGLLTLNSGGWMGIAKYRRISELTPPKSDSTSQDRALNSGATEQKNPLNFAASENAIRTFYEALRDKEVDQAKSLLASSHNPSSDHLSELAVLLELADLTSQADEKWAWAEVTFSNESVFAAFSIESSPQWNKISTSPAGPLWRSQIGSEHEQNLGQQTRLIFRLVPENKQWKIREFGLWPASLAEKELRSKRIRFSVDEFKSIGSSPSAVEPKVLLIYSGHYGDTSDSEANSTGPSAMEIKFDDLEFDLKKGEKFSAEMLSDRVKSLDGRSVRLSGYILPTSVFSQSNINRFVLVRHNRECCFGSSVSLYDCVVVEMQGGKTIDFVSRPVTIHGKFVIDTKSYRNVGGRSPSYYAIFRIEAEEVQ